MSSGLRKFKLLLWKNYVLQKRKPIVTAIEIGCVAFFSIILLLIRQRVQSTNITEPTTWKKFSTEKFPQSLQPPSTTAWKIYFASNDAVTTEIMNTVQKHFGNDDVSGVVGYPNETAMVDDIMDNLNHNLTNDILGGVVFENIVPNYTQFPSDITYKIRLSSSPRNGAVGAADGGTSDQDPSDPQNGGQGWLTNQVFPFFQQVGPRAPNSTWGGKPGYMKEGFLALQRAVDDAIIQHLYPQFNTSVVNVNLQRFPYPPYNDDKFVLVLHQQFPVILLLSFVFSALHIVKDIVMEKEKRIKETLKMMGIGSWLQWLAWFVKYFLFLFIAIAIMTLFFSIKVGKNGAIINYTSPAVVLLFLMSYSISIISFCFLVSVFFSRANSGAAAGGILFFVTYIPYSFVAQRYYQMSELAKLLCCLDFQMAMAFGAQVISMFEGTGAGVQFGNINQGASVDDSFTMLQVILMLLIDSVLYCLVAFYFEAIFPGEYGVPQPWYFPVLKSYWCGTVQIEKDAEVDDQETQQEEYFEKDPMGLRAGIRIKNLRKVFNKKVAVEGTSLNMYEGQITALLGHNGAGKTTTISMLTGFYPPTSGTALVNGYDIREDMSNVRGSLGICPQHDVLFDTLTVDEHLEFFAELKGCQGSEIRSEVDKMTEALGLNPKKNAQSKTLSGGMKRKLSVAMALVGGSKIVILDEPTSGMDPNARRKMWDILQRHRENRTMVLTTHFMDEADILGDRIAIMAEGVIKCCGSSLFLKKKYGAGYHMVIVKELTCNVEELTKVVQSHVPSAQLESNISAELSYVLPQDSSHQFEALFEEIEKNREELGVASYGASVTTMEEVFLRVGEGANLGVKQQHASENGVEPSTSSHPASSGPIFNMNIVKNLGLTLLMQQFRAMFVKRALHTMRNWLVTATQLVVPLFFTSTALLTVKLVPKPGASEPLLLNLGPFGDNYVAFSSGINNTQSNLTKLLASSYGSQFNEPEVKRIYLNNLTKYAAEPFVDKFLVDEGKASLGSYTNHYITGASFTNEKGQTNATGLFNDQAYHTPAITLNAIDNTILWRFVSSSYRINTINDPLPKTVADQIFNEINFDFNGFLISFNVMFGMAFLASSFVVFLIGERATKAKHCQFVSGAKWGVFWIATMLWDMINYMVPCILLLVVFAVFNVKAYTTDNHLGYVLLLFILFGWSMLPFMYIWSFLFKTPSTGFVWLTLWNVLAGTATVMAVVILEIPGLNTESLAVALEWVFLILIPNYCLGQGLMDLYNNYQYLSICSQSKVQFICEFTNITLGCCKDHCGDECLTYNENYLGWDAGGIGRALVFMAVQGCLYLIILSLIESGLLRKFWYKVTQGERSRSALKSGNVRQLSRSVSEVQEDDDVMKERDRVTLTPVLDLMTSHSLIMVQLTKCFGSTVAVDRLSIGIKTGECFGLLGNNGAGKTTTFRMLTGDETIGSGDSYLEGCDIKTQIGEVQSKLGYCPQFDALIDKLTGRETLRMYARLRGIHEEQIEKMVQQLIDTLLLQAHGDKLVKSYSGGNKRKLSTAIALVGDPPVVFLDEPTTGMDPVARRQLWDTLSRLRAAGTTLILTSHSMEECEALCTQIAIMVNGQVKCLGSTQHLKNKFGEGYTLVARVGATSTDPESSGQYPQTNAIMSFIQMTFPNTILKDVHQNMVHYYIPTDPSLTWAQIFGSIEKNKERLKIEDYSVSQTTLEQVFINFARAQVEPREVKSSCFGKCKWCVCGLCCCRFCCNSAQNNDELVSIVDSEHRPPTYT